jgi:glycosyltransferase involved in cell wall biosynthesis
MNPLKVYLESPWKLPDSPYYKYLVENPPKGISYLNTSNQRGAIINKKKFILSNKVKRSVRRITRFFKLPILNARLTASKSNFDLIHCAHCLSINQKKPWVADFEGVWQCWVSGSPEYLGKNIIKKILMNPNCKKIMPWTAATRDEFRILFPEIEDKIEIVYPAVPIQGRIFRNSKRITLLYVSRYFWIKGGLIALEAIRLLKKKYDLDIIFISDVPKAIKDQYPDIVISDLVSPEKLYKYYLKSDIFFYPSLVDTFGFSLLEAMSFGLPIVSVYTEYTKTRKEIIQDGKTGFLVDVPEKLDFYKIGPKERKIISQLVNKVSILVENSCLRKKMSRTCFNLIKSGKFSIKGRNKKLKRIYLEALK